MACSGELPGRNSRHAKRNYAYLLQVVVSSEILRGMAEKSDKQKVVAGLLGIFLGAYGVHSFYLGNAKKGVLQLVLTIITLGIAGLWGFIEGILILVNGGVDAEGRELV
jgi:TM2 domain-containing membrane protein YozV